MTDEKLEYYLGMVERHGSRKVIKLLLAIIDGYKLTGIKRVKESEGK